MADVRMTKGMELADLKLQNQSGKTLAQFIRAARKENKETGRPEKTWDDVAFDIRTLTGEKVVRETVINWATRLGLASRVVDPGVPADQEAA